MNLSPAGRWFQISWAQEGPTASQPYSKQLDGKVQWKSVAKFVPLDGPFPLHTAVQAEELCFCCTRFCEGHFFDFIVQLASPTHSIPEFLKGKAKKAKKLDGSYYQPPPPEPINFLVIPPSFGCHRLPTRRQPKKPKASPPKDKAGRSAFLPPRVLASICPSIFAASRTLGCRSIIKFWHRRVTAAARAVAHN